MNLLCRITLLFSSLMLLGPGLLYSQLISQDSTVLLNLLNENCISCPLDDPQDSQHYWNPGEPASTWYGVTVAGGRVISLSLDSMGLQGELTDLNDCSALEGLSLRGNSLSDIGQLNQNTLEKLNVADNLIDSISSSIYLRNLNYLDCSSNLLEHLPDTNSFPRLDTLICDSNEIYVRDLEFFAHLDSFSFWQGYFGVLAQSHILDPIIYIIDEADSCIWPDIGPIGKFLSGDSTELTFPDPFGGQMVYDSACIPSYFALDIPPQFDSVVIYNNLTSHPHLNYSVDSQLVVVYTPPSHFHNTLLNSTFFFTIDYRSSTTYVLCGDSNNDTIRDMFDLFPIASFWNETGTERTVFSNPSESQFNLAVPWLEQLNHKGQTINACFADSNGDGIVNQQDLGCIEENYTPLSQINYLNSTVQDTIALRTVPQDLSIQLFHDGKVKIPFRIQIDELPSSIDSTFMRGIVFIRAVAESDAFQTDSIYGDFTFSDFADSMAQIVGMQMYMDTTVLDTGEWNCLDVTSKQLDVGVFRNDTSEWMHSNESILDCHVLIHPEDNLRTGLPDSIIPVIADVNSIVLFLQDQNGDIYEVTAACKSDTTILIMDSLRNQTCIIGDVYHTSGLPIEGAEITSSGPYGNFRAFSDQDGEYSLIVPWHAQIDVSLDKAKDSLSAASIDQDDLGELADFIFFNGTLTSEQMVAADLNGDDKVDLTDYLELRDYVNQVTSSFSIGKDWVFINDDDPISTQPKIRYTSTRDYTSAYRNYGQDYKGILVGDVNLSWGNPAASNKTTWAEPQISGEYLLSKPYPNPSNGHLNFDYHFPEQQQLTISAFDMKGRVLYSQEIATPSGLGTFSINLQQTVTGAGVIFLRVNSAQIHEVFKVSLF